MKKNYEKPTLRTSCIDLEEFICVIASKEAGCPIYPIDPDVAGFINQGEQTYGDDYLLKF